MLYFLCLPMSLIRFHATLVLSVLLNPIDRSIASSNESWIDRIYVALHTGTMDSFESTRMPLYVSLNTLCPRLNYFIK